MNEDRIISIDHCWGCLKKTVIMVKLTDDGIKTRSFIGVCINLQCFRFTNAWELATWQKANPDDVRREQIAMNSSVRDRKKV